MMAKKSWRGLKRCPTKGEGGEKKKREEGETYAQPGEVS
jgi:hypothetical protein